MKSYQLIQALEDGRELYRGDENHRLHITAHRGDGNKLLFHLYGWGSAADPDTLLPLLMSHPEQFSIAPEPMPTPADTSAPSAAGDAAIAHMEAWAGEAEEYDNGTEGPDGMIVRALFTGKPAQGFKTGREYRLRLEKVSGNNDVQLVVYTEGNGPLLSCPYGSAIAFLNNWTNVRPE